MQIIELIAGICGGIIVGVIVIVCVVWVAPRCDTWKGENIKLGNMLMMGCR